MLPAQQVVDQLRSPGLGFDRVDLIPGSTYRDNSTVIIIPTRGTIHYRVVAAWQALMAPMNQPRCMLFAAGDEVGKAYNALVQNVLANPDMAKFKYLMTLEDDNLVPADAQIRLLESIEAGPFDAVSGIYFTKGDHNMPMAYGNPDEYRETGVLDFKPLDVRHMLQKGQTVEVNGIAMGCALWRMDLFRQFTPPWFVTVTDIIPEKGAIGFTQDLWFCRKLKLAGKRLAVDCRVKVGHLDINSGVVY